MKKIILIIIGGILTFNSFSQKSKKYPDYFVQKDTTWCKVLWHNDSIINYTNSIIELMGYQPKTVRKSLVKSYKIYSTDAIDYGRKTEKRIVEENLYSTPRNSSTPISNTFLTSGNYLTRAGNCGLASIGVGFLTGGIVLLMPNDNADIKTVVGAAGGLLSIAFAISAWNNVKLAGRYLNNEKTSVFISPSNIKLSYRF